MADAVNVWSLVAHHAHVVGADVELADVVTPEDEDIGFLVLRASRSDGAQQHRRSGQQGQTAIDYVYSFHIFLYVCRV